MDGGRALRAVGVADVAHGALVASGPHEPRIASALTCRRVRVRCHVGGFAAAVNGGRAPVSYTHLTLPTNREV